MSDKQVQAESSGQLSHNAGEKKAADAAFFQTNA